MLNWLYDIFNSFTEGWFIVILIICLAIGVLLLVKGADVFVSGASHLAKKMKVPTIIIGLTIVSMGTSAPEASVSINAALSNSDGLSVGNVIGSNICNILLILGISALITPIVIKNKNATKDIIIMIGAAVLLMIFFFIIDVDGNKGISLIEGIILFTGIIAYIIYNIIISRKSADNLESETTKEEKQKNIILILVMLVVGLVCILLGGDLVTYSASEIAAKMGVSEVLIGLTVVSICTSLPELVTTLVASIKKENDIAIGNVVGSNIFNILFILGISAVITPLYIDIVIIIDILIMITVSALVLVLYKFWGKITRNIGMIMLLLYVLYIGYLVFREIGLIV